MRKIFVSAGQRIRRLIDFFYPPFHKYVTIQIFRYGVSGAANMIFDWVLYYLVYHFVLRQEMLHLGIFTLSSHIASMVIVFPFSSFSGFLLQKYVTFTTSELRGHVQLYRYFLIVGLNLGLNYIGLKILVDGAGFFATPSRMIVTILTTIFSYFSQKKFTFNKTGSQIC